MKPRRHDSDPIDGPDPIDDFDPIDGLLRQTFDVPNPTAGDLARAERAYRSGIEGPESAFRSVYGSVRLRPRLATISVALVVVLAIFAVQLSRPTSAAIAISEIAEAARLVEPIDVPEQSYAYTQSETVALTVVPLELLGESGGDFGYLLPVQQVIWIGSDGATHLRTSTGEPLFFDPTLEAKYYDAGLDKFDSVGETRTETAIGVEGILDERQWPTDTDELNKLLTSIAPEPDRRIQLALSIVRETAASPELRSATLETIATIDGLELVEDFDDRFVFEIEVTLGKTGLSTPLSWRSMGLCWRNPNNSSRGPRLSESRQGRSYPKPRMARPRSSTPFRTAQTAADANTAPESGEPNSIGAQRDSCRRQGGVHRSR